MLAVPTDAPIDRLIKNSTAYLSENLYLLPQKNGLNPTFDL